MADDDLTSDATTRKHLVKGKKEGCKTSRPNDNAIILVNIIYIMRTLHVGWDGLKRLSHDRLNVPLPVQP